MNSLIFTWRRLWRLGGLVNPQHGHIRLTLPFRKTYQMGRIKSFPLWFNTKRKHLDPVYALVRWIHCSQITSDFIFRRFTRNSDQVSLKDKPLSRDAFVENFRRNLLEIGQNPKPYDSHSFRRGANTYIRPRAGPFKKFATGVTDPPI